MKEPTMISKMRCGRCGKIIAGMGMLLFTLVLVAFQAQAMVLDTGNPDLFVRFDNTVKYSAGLRVADQNQELMAVPNTDDAERNFDKGLVLNRFDLLSEFDMQYNKFGVRFSGAGWYDFVYTSENDNDSQYTVNQYSVDYNEFTDDTKKWHGRGAELLDAYTWGAVDMGDMTLRYRAGQYAQQWGETMFLADNGITGALAPINVAKVATVPNAELKEFIMPVPQAWAGLQVTDEIEISAVYQFQWEPNRLFAAGSYYSPADLIGPLGSERILAGPDNQGLAFVRTDDVEASDDGQYGLKVKWVSPIGVDFGLYYLNVHSRGFYVITGLELGTPPGAPPDVMVPLPNYYYFLYPEDIKYYGVTATTNIGIYPLSVEATYRTNAPLASNDITLMPGQTFTNDDDPLYPVGNTLHVAFTSFSPGNAGRLFCDEYDIIAEVAFDYLASVDKNEDMLLDGTKDFAWEVQVAYTPKWHQVFPNWDLYLPMGIAYSPEGRAAGMQSGAMGNHHGGSWNFGLEAWYNQVWKMGLAYTDYFGKIENQPFKDRDTVQFYITRTF